MRTSPPRLHSLAALALLLRTAAAWDCKLQLGNDRFDLSPLDKVHSVEREVPTPPTTTKYTYSLSLCSPLPLSSAPSDEQCPEDTYLCGVVESVKAGHDNWLISVLPIAREQGLDPKAAYLDGESGIEKGWRLTLGGGSYNEVEQKVEVGMVCDTAASSDTKPTFESYDASTGTLKLRWVSAAACSTTSDAPPSPPPSDDTPKEGDKAPPSQGTPPPEKKRGGMGFFSWFFTLFFLAFVAYFAVGCYSNYTQYGATGWDMVPHRDVWRDLPYVVADLFRGRGGGRSGYSSLG